MRFIPLASAVLAAAIAAPAQINNFGLTLSTGGSVIGRSCNNSGCQAAGTAVSVGAAITLDIWGAPGSVYVLGLGPLSRNCLSIPGITNGIMLGQPADTLSIGFLSQPSGPSLCFTIQESASVPLTVPAGASGGVYRFQALTFGGVGTNVTAVVTDAIDLTVL